jgi:hypothetical protein
VEQQGIVCPECNTLNEIGWLFCQQCGKRLPKPQSPATPPTVDAKTPEELKTVPEQRAAIDPSLAKSLKTVAEKPVEQGLKTVAEESHGAEPEPPIQPPPAAPPADVVELQASEQPTPSSPEASSEIPTVAAEAVSKPKPAAAPQPDEKPSTPPPIIAEESKTQHVHSLSGVLCTQCGQVNNVSSAFCASCGAPITFGKTMVMSSQQAPARGRLHLVMEGGQPGEVYDLSDETVIGRSSGDIIFPHDGFMSGRHAKIIQRGGSFMLTDDGSRNGTFVKIKGEVELKSGDMILVGKQLFRFEV